MFFEEQLKKEINEDREVHEEKPLKEKKRRMILKIRLPVRAALVSKRVRATREVDDSGKVSIRMFLCIPCRQPVIKMGGFLVTV